MTSNDVPAPGSGAPAGRRRALGRGPGAAPVAPVAPAVAPAAPVEPPRHEDPPKPEPHSGAVERAAPAGPEATAPAADLAPDAAASAAQVEPGAGLSVVDPVPEAGGLEERAARGEPEAARAAESEPEAAASSAQVEPGAVERAAERGPEVVVADAGGGSGAVVANAEAEAGAVVPRPDAAPSDGVFKVRLANFEGPFDLLLQLISKHKLDVTEVALSKVTDEFMAHIRAMGPDWDLDQTTEFLVVAATLLDLKAARLLPAAEVEDEADLALLEARDLLFARLLQYRAYKQVADIFNAKLVEEARRYPRTVGLEPHHAELLPEVVISIGAEGFAKLAVKAMQPKPKPQVYVDHIHAPLVSVQEQAGIVVARLRALGEASFRTLVEDTDDTLTVVARFLALLELYREKAVALDQETALGELLVRWTGGDGEETPRVTDEFDRPPEEPKEERKP
ncbi:segregation/condensation protein A [Streptomyces sp. NPDC052015]|uniref:segregation and condensation protein A n=1 Tax=Streptomyces sp. NPDC052015 TaxID=3154755 RepID=UPI00342C0E19